MTHQVKTLEPRGALLQTTVVPWCSRQLARVIPLSYLLYSFKNRHRSVTPPRALCVATHDGRRGISECMDDLEAAISSPWLASCHPDTCRAGVGEGCGGCACSTTCTFRCSELEPWVPVVGILKQDCLRAPCCHLRSEGGGGMALWLNCH